MNHETQNVGPDNPERLKELQQQLEEALLVKVDRRLEGRTGQRAYDSFSPAIHVSAGVGGIPIGFAVFPTGPEDQRAWVPQSWTGLKDNEEKPCMRGGSERVIEEGKDGPSYYRSAYQDKLPGGDDGLRLRFAIELFEPHSVPLFAEHDRKAERIVQHTPASSRFEAFEDVEGKPAGIYRVAEGQVPELVSAEDIERLVELTSNDVYRQDPLTSLMVQRPPSD